MTPDAILTTKRDQILTAAFQAFASYGFKRTSMEDIAKLATMSRPALYQVFSNKKEIYRALTEAKLQEVAAASEDVLLKNMPLDQTLEQIFEHSVLNPHAMLEELPHGEELMGLKNEIAGEVHLQWSQMIKELILRALRQNSDLLDAEIQDTANMIELAIAGMKSHGFRVEQLRKDLAGLRRIVATLTN